MITGRRYKSRRSVHIRQKDIVQTCYTESSHNRSAWRSGDGWLIVVYSCIIIAQFLHEVYVNGFAVSVQGVCVCVRVGVRWLEDAER